LEESCYGFFIGDIGRDAENAALRRFYQDAEFGLLEGFGIPPNEDNGSCSGASKVNGNVLTVRLVV
jgi:hypothetical protein